MGKIGFDSEKYLAEQTRYILERVHMYNKLYIEFGGKLMNDLHLILQINFCYRDVQIYKMCS